METIIMISNMGLGAFPNLSDLCLPTGTSYRLISTPELGCFYFESLSVTAVEIFNLATRISSKLFFQMKSIPDQPNTRTLPLQQR